jgi:hypothetical protein
VRRWTEALVTGFLMGVVVANAYAMGISGEQSWAVFWEAGSGYQTKKHTRLFLIVRCARCVCVVLLPRRFGFRVNFHDCRRKSASVTTDKPMLAQYFSDTNHMRRAANCAQCAAAKNSQVTRGGQAGISTGVARVRKPLMICFQEAVGKILIITPRQ